MNVVDEIIYHENTHAITRQSVAQAAASTAGQCPKGTDGKPSTPCCIVEYYGSLNGIVLCNHHSMKCVDVRPGMKNNDKCIVVSLPFIIEILKYPNMIDNVK